MANEIVPASSSTERDGPHAGGLAVAGETAVATVAAQAQAQVQARYIVALKRPRDIDDVRVRLLRECRRPSFAEVARYRKPIGKGVEGPSIRFVETALRCMSNILQDTTTIYDDGQKRIVRVMVSDLEGNVSYSKDLTIDKTVERSQVKEGQKVLSVRVNSRGQSTYLLEATEDDLLMKEGALVSKAVRTLGLRILPGDLVDEAQREAITTVHNRDAQDPDAARKNLLDSFALIGVMPSDLRAWLGHEVDQASSSQICDLRNLYAAIRDGAISMHDAIEARKAERQSQADTGLTTRTESVKNKLAAKTAKANATAVARQPEEPPAAMSAPDYVKSAADWLAALQANDPAGIIALWKAQESAFAKVGRGLREGRANMALDELMRRGVAMEDARAEMEQT